MAYEKLFSLRITHCALLFVGCASAEEVVDYGGAAVAPKEINHADSIYFTRPNFRFYSMWFAHDLLPKAEHNQPWLIAMPKNN